MRIVNIGKWKINRAPISSTQRTGIVVRDHSVSLARMLPFRQDAGWEREEQLVASDALKMPEEMLDWDECFLAPAGNVSREIAVEAALENRGDR